jgi:MFS transporter, FHS family, glucose/mannose:H+ symporter
MYAFSSLLAPLGAAYFFRNDIGWRTAFCIFAGFSIISLISTFFVREQKEQQHAQAHKKHPKRKVYWLVGSMLSFYILSELLLSTRLTLYLRRAFQYQPDEAALLLSGFFVLLLLGRLFFLLFPVRLRTLKIIEISLVLTFIFNVLGLWLEPRLLMLCGLTMAPVFALSLDYLAEIFPSYSADAIASCLAISCLYIVSMHFVMGLLTDIFGIEKAMWCGPLFVVVAFILLRVVGRRPIGHYS